MPVVEKTTGGRVYVRDIGHFERGTQRDVSDDDADYLVNDRGDFEIVDEDESPQEAESDDESASSEDATEESEPDEDVEDEPAGGDEPDARGEAEALADEHWQRAVSAIEDGEADHVLDELEAIDDRNSVQSAIDERRAELEG